MLEQKIVLIGGGGHCKSCIDVIESAKHYRIKYILDRENTIGNQILNYSINGLDDRISELAFNYEFLITVGQILSPLTRIKIFDSVKVAGGKLVTIIAATATLSKYSSIGEGTILMHQSVVNADATVDVNCIVNTKALIEHDSKVGKHCHISTGAIINGGVVIGDNCFIGSGAIVAHNVNIVANTIIGAGSVVLKSINIPGVYMGNPIKFIRNL